MREFFQSSFCSFGDSRSDLVPFPVYHPLRLQLTWHLSTAVKAFSQKVLYVLCCNWRHLIVLLYLDLGPRSLFFVLLVHLLMVSTFDASFCCLLLRCSPIHWSLCGTGSGSVILKVELIWDSSFAFLFKALGDQILFVTRPDKRQLLYYNDKSCHFSVDEGKCLFYICIHGLNSM